MAAENFKKEWDYIQETANKNGFESKILQKIFKKHERKFAMSQVTSLRNESKQENETKGYIGIPFLGSLTENLK